jgi:uncharacterized protein DUF4236
VGSFRFRRTITIAPGVRININKRSVGLSAGTRGVRASINSDGRSTRSIGIPGSGLYYRSQTGPRRGPHRRIPAAVGVDPNSGLGTVLAWIGALALLTPVALAIYLIISH